MLISDISLIGWLHSVACLIAIGTGAYILAARKGTKIHRRLCWWYAGAMVALNLSVMVIYRFDFLPGTQSKPGPGIFGFFHYGALVELAAVALAVFAASRQRRNSVWAHVHAQAMLGSYYGLIGGLINEMFFRVVPLRALAEQMSPHAANVSRTTLVALTQDAAVMLWLALAVIFFRQVVRAHRRHDSEAFTIGYPLRYSGGAFVAWLGMFGAFWRNGSHLGMAVAVGLISGALLLPMARRAAAAIWGAPTEKQTSALVLAVGLEISLFTVLGVSGFFQRVPPAVAAETAFGVVAAHFLVLRWSHGPMMLRLGLSVLAWLALSMVLRLPLPLVAIGDGLIKLGFGLAMVEPFLLRRGYFSPVLENGLSGAAVGSNP
jgi:uncharacterized membrane protein